MNINKMDEYLFDLRGYLHLEKALSPGEVSALNREIDGIPDIGPGEWFGHLHREEVEPERGIAYQQMYEAGPGFESLIDHPSWIDHVKHFVGGEGTFDWWKGPVFIDESFASLRGPGEAIGLHSGGHEGTKRTQFRYHSGRFHCGQINVLLALTDIGPGDGGTMVIPGSHKANLEHPRFAEKKIGAAGGGSVEGTEGAIEVRMRAGDALLFVDAISHGSARRVNEGQRRIVVYRYGPSWGFFRFGYRPSPELLERLTPERRQIVWPHEEWERTPNHKTLKTADAL
jgi:hypothetical protein